MSRLKYFCLFGLVFIMLISMVIGCAAEDVAVDDVADVVESAFPERPITMVVQWGAGGRTDLIGRGVVPHAEKELGQPIIVTNITGAVGSVGMQFVFDQKADGYTVGMFAENPALYPVMEMSERSFNEFDPIIILALAKAVLVAHPDSQYQSIEDLIEDVLARPGQVTLGTGGPGADEVEVFATFLTDALGTKFSHVPYDGDQACLVAVMSGEIDVTVLGIAAGIEYLRSGEVKGLAVIDTDIVTELPDVPPITQAYPELNKYLPWAPFYGIWVKKETPDDIKAILTDAFLKGADSPEYQKFLEDLVISPVNLTGDDARKFVDHWTSAVAWAIWDAGAAMKSPEELNIPRP